MKEAVETLHLLVVPGSLCPLLSAPATSSWLPPTLSATFIACVILPVLSLSLVCHFFSFILF